jgi:hypothetical protein
MAVEPFGPVGLEIREHVTFGSVADLQNVDDLRAEVRDGSALWISSVGWPRSTASGHTCWVAKHRMDIAMRSNHRLILALLFSAHLCVCEPIERTGKASAPIAGVAGNWEMEFVATKGPGRGAKARGVLTLRDDPAPAPPCFGEEDARLCATHTRGIHRVATKTLLGHALSQEASGGLLSDDEVLVVIGACCDRGEVSAKGRWRNGRFEGHWSDTWLSGAAAQGRFTMRRLPSE